MGIEKKLIMLMNPEQVFDKCRNQQLFWNDSFALLTSFIGDSQFDSCLSAKQYGSVIVIQNNKMNQKESSMWVIPEVFRWNLFSWHIRRQSFIYEPLHHFILRCHQNGLIHHLIEEIIPKLSDPKQSETQKLTIYTLSAGFYIWLYTVLIAIIVFLMEQGIFYFSNRKRRLDIA